MYSAGLGGDLHHTIFIYNIYIYIYILYLYIYNKEDSQYKFSLARKKRIRSCTSIMLLCMYSYIWNI